MNDAVWATVSVAPLLRLLHGTEDEADRRQLLRACIRAIDPQADVLDPKSSMSTNKEK